MNMQAKASNINTLTCIIDCSSWCCRSSTLRFFLTKNFSMIKKSFTSKKGKQTARHAAVPAPTQQYQNDNEIFVLLHNRHRSNTKLEKKSMVSGGGGFNPQTPPPGCATGVNHLYCTLEGGAQRCGCLPTRGAKKVWFAPEWAATSGGGCKQLGKARREMARWLDLG